MLVLAAIAELKRVALVVETRTTREMVADKLGRLTYPVE
jgi:hypothetical protein